MFVSKMGSSHKDALLNNQDFGFFQPALKCVVDGCSEGKHSEVGAKIFCHLFSKNHDVKQTMEQLSVLFPRFEDIKDHLLFTILYVEESSTHFHVHYAGDGFIITKRYHEPLSYIPLDYEGAPPYWAYNLVDPRYLKKYNDGVHFEIVSFSKEEFEHVGVATDGLSYVLGSEHQEEFEKYLLEHKENRLKLLFNRIHPMLHDDLTIAW